MLRGLADRVISALMKGMALRQSLHTQPYASRAAIVPYGVQHVLGAGGTETTGRRQPGRKRHFVQPQQKYQTPLHLANTRPTSRHRSSYGAVKTVRRGLNTTAQSFGRTVHCVRTASRMRRFMRLRNTALPSARGTVKPKRDGTPSPVRRQKAAK